MERRISFTILIAVLAMTMMPAVGNAKTDGMPKNVKSRYLSGGYNYFSGSSEEGADYSVAEPVVFDVNKQERWVSILIQDTTGRPAPAQVGQDLDGDEVVDETWDVCGTTEAPMDITPDKPLYVTVAPGACGAGVEPASGGAVYVELFSPGIERIGGPAHKVTRDVNITYAGAYYEDGTGSIGGNAFRMDRLSYERFMTVESTDASGLPPLVTVYSENGPPVTICGATDGPVKLPPGSDLLLHVSSGACEQAPAVATTGEVRITLSNQP
jgi:hypothetical protein